eukprot:TRINITY_DN21509_c0_g1_i1.p1 TRINITY_DN21509_c0_g1~~TRINITY_DN21509_c0_g1_i1.p1  ORF type:complete len:168 (-),score=28.24 TRINITY_DN21509_c0_g1_i1:35-538(-)
MLCLRCCRRRGSTDEKNALKVVAVNAGQQNEAEQNADAAFAVTEHRWLSFQLDVAADQTTVALPGTRPMVKVERHNTCESGEGSGVLGDIFKVQVAQGRLIMMVYDKSRTRSTFIHDRMEGFKEIYRLALYQPKQKAYFWGRDDAPGETGERYISLNATVLAPLQPW